MAPIYTYLCKSCGEFELFQTKTDPIEVCPKCGYSTVQRLISPTSPPKFIGSGFYENDYKSTKKTPQRS